MLLFGMSVACAQEAVTVQAAEPVEIAPVKAEPIRTASVGKTPAKLSAGEQLAAADTARAPAADKPMASAPKPVAVTLNDPVLARGQTLFAKQCAICHGDTGDGGGKFAYLMNPRPRNFQVGKFKLATTQNQVPSDKDLLRTISRGMPGSAMPPWNHLPLADLEALVKFVRHIHAQATKAELDRMAADGTFTEAEAGKELEIRTQPGLAMVVPPEPEFDDLRWFRGRQAYLEACASCHGADGQPVAAAVKYDEEGYPVPPRSFVAGIFKGGSEGHQLYTRIFKGMRGTPMPSYEGVFDDGTTWDLIHYVQSLARAGAQERAQLRQDTIVAPQSASLPTGPMDAQWQQARGVYVGLTPLWWTEDRIEGLTVQALHTENELALRLAWIDPTQDARAVRQNEFRDAVAIQFSMSSDPPFYMGAQGEAGGVNIWMWKADRAKDLADGYQDVDEAFPDRAVDMYDEQNYETPRDQIGIEWPKGKISDHRKEFITAWGAGNMVANHELKTPVESLVAKGPGTLSALPPNIQIVQGQAVYERGVWYVQLNREMQMPGEANGSRSFKRGDYLPISLAIWNGSAGDRDGKKNISIWQKLIID
jgi:DMSO reductase family type II enzyme heme b subunit